METEERNKLIQHISGNYLCENLPDHWEILAENELYEFIEENKWEPLEYYSPEQIFEMISNSSYSTELYIKKWYTM